MREFAPLQKRLCVQESKQDVTKVVSLVKMVEILPSVYSALTLIAVDIRGFWE